MNYDEDELKKFLNDVMEYHKEKALAEFKRRLNGIGNIVVWEHHMTVVKACESLLREVEG